VVDLPTPMSDRGSPFGLVVRVGPPLAVLATAGFVLGSCGGGEGGALTTATGVTVTRPALTATRPATTEEPAAPTRTVEPTLPTRTQPPTTETIEVEETTVEVTTTERSTTVTLETTVETQTTVSVTIVPTTTTTTPETTAATTEEESSGNDTPWGWIALGVALAAALLVAFLLWRRRRTQAASWSARLADLSRRSLVALDDVIARGSVVTGQVEALAAEARSLEARAPDDQSRASAARLRARLDELANTLESDRALRLSSPPPSDEQLSYSTALIRQQAEQLKGVLRTPASEPEPPGTTDTW
jgi:hypothetical protein